MKKLIIAGGTGFLGTALVNFLEEQFDEIVVLSRSEAKKRGKIKIVLWDARTLGEWRGELEQASVVINLTGKNINCRLTKKNREEILRSRVNATQAIGEAIMACKIPPALWINGSATNMYADSVDRAMTENNFVPATGFWADVCNAWELACTRWDLSHTRTVLPRITPVFEREGGVFPVLRGLVKKGMGGTMGPGDQKISWIHIEDFCRTIQWMIDNESASGPYNTCAPEVVSNEEQMRILRKILGVPFGIPAPAWALEVGAFFMRTESDLILNSRYVYPERLINEGFKFKFPQFTDCIIDLSNQK